MKKEKVGVKAEKHPYPTTKVSKVAVAVRAGIRYMQFITQVNKAEEEQRKMLLKDKK